MAYAILDQQYTQEKKKLESQVTSQHEAIRAEATKARTEAQAFRPRAIEIPQEPGVTAVADSGMKQKREALAEIDRWEREQLRNLTQAHLGAIKELKQAKQQAVIETRELEKQALAGAKAATPENAVQLTTGEFIDKVEFNKLTKKQQDLLRAIGVDQFNVTQEVVAQRAAADYIKLSTGEYVGKAEFNALSSVDQNLLKSVGVNQFNAQKKIEFADFEKNNIKLDTGEHVPRSDYDALSSEQRTYLKAHGVDKFNEYVEANLQVEIETAKGKVAMPLKDWEAMPEIKQYEVALGRHPTLSEWMGYRLSEAGVEWEWWEFPRFFPGFSEVAGIVQLTIPGMQKHEYVQRVRAVAEDEWQHTYPEEAYTAPPVAALESMGFLAAKAMYPQITVKDVTGKEWALTGANIALWALPLWMPKVVSGLKAIIPSRFTARLRTVPFSEAPGLRRVPVTKPAPVPRVATIGPAEVGMGAAQFQRFLKARVASPRLTPQIFKVLEGVKIRPPAKLPFKAPTKVPVKAPIRVPIRKPVGLPKYTYPRRVGVRELTSAEWLAKWKPSQVQPTFPAPGVTSPASGWILTPAGKYMPAGAAPVTILDVPVGLVIRSPIIGPTGRIVTPITTAKIAESLGLTQAQVAGAQPLSATQVTKLSKLLGVAEAQVKTIAKQGALSKTITQSLTKLQAKLQNLTNTQALALTETLTQLQTKPLTATQLQNLTKTLGLTATQTQTLLKSLTQLQPAVQVMPATKAPAVTDIPVTKRILKRIPKRVGRRLWPPKKKEEKEEEEKKEYPDGTIVWKGGIFYKIIPPPYTLKKPISSKTPPAGMTKTEGTPQETLTFLGGKLPFANVAFDLGVVDGFIDVKERKIHFTGEGEKTDVGKRLPSPTRGLTLSEAIAGEGEMPVMKPKQFANRIRPRTAQRRVKREPALGRTYLGRGLEHPDYMRKVK